MAIKAFIFDLDGTLVCSMKAHKEAYREAFAKFKLNFNSKIFEESFGENVYVWAPKMGINSKVAIGLIREEKARAFPRHLHHIEINSRIMRLAERLSERGQIALCTSASPTTVSSILKLFGLEDFFDCIVTSSDVTHLKPNPEAYQLILEKLKLKASECLAFEDSVSGIAAAQSAHITCIDVSKSNLRANEVTAKKIIRAEDHPVRFFAGGSGSTTYVSRAKDGPLVVTKVAKSATAERLREQSEWLKKHSQFEHHPKIIDDQTSEQTYSYRMKYLDGMTPLSKYLNRNPDIDQSTLLEKIIQTALSYPRNSHYVEPNSVKTYIQLKLLPIVNHFRSEGCNEIAVELIKLLQHASENEFFLNAISNTHQSTIHGDLSAENILTDGTDIIFIDPNPNQIIHCAEVDLGKLRMSLHSRYEEFRFLRSVDDQSSHLLPGRTSYLFDHLCSKILNPDSSLMIRFHEAAHLIRALPYLSNARRKGAVITALAKSHAILKATTLEVMQSNHFAISNRSKIGEAS